MWNGLTRTHCGLLLFLLLCFSLSAYGLDTDSAKQKAIQLSLQQEVLLLQAEKDINYSRQAMMDSEQQLQQTQKEDELKYNALLKQFEERKVLYEKLKAAYEDLLKSIAQSEASLKASRTERDIAIGIAVSIAALWGSKELGHAWGWW